MSLERPLFLEGEPGVGKTEVAKALSAWTGGHLIRLQCYEGLDAAQAVYEWDYTRQLSAPAGSRGNGPCRRGRRARARRRALRREVSGAAAAARGGFGDHDCRRCC